MKNFNVFVLGIVFCSFIGHSAKAVDCLLNPTHNPLHVTMPDSLLFPLPVPIQVGDASGLWTPQTGVIRIDTAECGQFNTFCIEIDEGLQLSAEFEYFASTDLANSPIAADTTIVRINPGPYMGTEKANLLRKLWYYKGPPCDDFSAWLTGLVFKDRVIQTAAFQLALWEVIYDDGVETGIFEVLHETDGGFFWVPDDGNEAAWANQAAEMAENWLNEIKAYEDITDVQLIVLTNAGAQDLITITCCDGRIGDYVWIDENRDGIQDDGEAAIAGVEIFLGHGDSVLSTFTDENGFYLFDGLCAGEYTVWVNPDTIPEGYFPTIINAPGSTPENDSDDPAGTLVVLDEINNEDLTIDFGYTTECVECVGGVTMLTLQYLGDYADAIEVYYQGELIFEANVDSLENGIFTIAGDETLAPKIYIVEYNKRWCKGKVTKIDTSCEEPIGPGAKFGKFLVVSGYSLNGGMLCPLTDPECGECDGKVTWLTLRNDSTKTVNITVCQKGDAKYKKRGYKYSICDTFYNVSPGESFTVIGQDKHGTLGTDIIVKVNGCYYTRIHTSCSQPIGPGMKFGKLTVVEGASRNGGLLCPVKERPKCDWWKYDKEDDDDHEKEDKKKKLGDLLDKWKDHLKDKKWKKHKSHGDDD